MNRMLTPVYTQSIPWRRFFGAGKVTSMIHVAAEIATAISTVSLVATVALNAYLVTLAIRGSKTPVQRERTPTRH
jgi:hypothetical protein